MKKLNVLDWTTIIILVIGGLNWGLVGAFGFNLVESIFGATSFLTRLVYAIVGVSAIYVFFESFAWNRTHEPTIGEAMKMHKA